MSYPNGIRRCRELGIRQNNTNGWKEWWRSEEEEESQGQEGKKERRGEKREKKWRWLRLNKSSSTTQYRLFSQTTYSLSSDMEFLRLIGTIFYSLLASWYFHHDSTPTFEPTHSPGVKEKSKQESEARPVCPSCIYFGIIAGFLPWDETWHSTDVLYQDSCLCTEYCIRHHDSAIAYRPLPPLFHDVNMSQELSVCASVLPIGWFMTSTTETSSSSIPRMVSSLDWIWHYILLLWRPDRSLSITHQELLYLS